VIRAVRWKDVFSLCLLLCLELGRGGSGGSQVVTSKPQNPVPMLSGVGPNSTIAGSATLTITVSGSGFVAASVIEWNSAVLATTFVSSTSLSAQIPAYVPVQPQCLYRRAITINSQSG